MASPHEGGLNMPAGPVALIYATMAIGAVVTPLLVGLLCDRLFAVQRVLAVLHLVGAGLLAAMLCWCVASREDVWTVFYKTAESRGARDFRNEIARIQYLNEFLRDPDLAHFRKRRHDKWVTPMVKACYWIGIDSSDPEVLFALGEAFNEMRWGPLSTAESAQSELDELSSRLRPVIQCLREHPAVLAAADRAFPPLFALMLAYSCVYVPTITLSNVVAFRNLPDPGRQYGRFRALGTLGWIVAGLFVGFAAPAVSPMCFLFAAIVSGVLGVLCFFLPHTPPTGTARTVGDALGLPALRMLAERSFLVYVLTAVIATALMPFHNIYTNKFLVDLRVDHPAAVQTLAQPTEILGAILIPWVWHRLGTKWMLTLGLLASAARFFMYATESVPGMIALGLPLHGVGFAFFYIAAALYVDREAPTDLRASAQGLVTLLTLGLGGIVGNWFAGRVVEFHTAGGIVDWRAVWLVPALGTLAAALMFATFFRGHPVRHAS
jgi:nucleoside transporter